MQAKTDSCVLETELHAIERLVAQGQGRPADFIPIRFAFANKLGSDDKLLLGFDVFVPSKSLGRKVGTGKIIHGDDSATLKANTWAKGAGPKGPKGAKGARVPWHYLKRSGAAVRGERGG